MSHPWPSGSAPLTAEAVQPLRMQAALVPTKPSRRARPQRCCAIILASNAPVVQHNLCSYLALWLLKRESTNTKPYFSFDYISLCLGETRFSFKLSFSFLGAPGSLWWLPLCPYPTQFFFPGLSPPLYGHHLGSSCACLIVFLVIWPLLHMPFLEGAPLHHHSFYYTCAQQKKSTPWVIGKPVLPPYSEGGGNVNSLDIAILKPCEVPRKLSFPHWHLASLLPFLLLIN